MNRTPFRRWVLLVFAGILILGAGAFFFYGTNPGSPSIVVPSPVPSSSPSPSPTPVITKPLNYNFGISLGDTLPYLIDSDLNKEMDDIASLGIGWVRLDMGWNDIQPNDAGDFTWTTFDRIVTAANARQIKLLPIIGYTPRWAQSPACSGNPKCEPSDPNLFAAFAQAAAQRYTSQGIFAWEIWNEPNSQGFWKPSANVDHYETLLKDADLAIQQQNPSAFVIAGGLAATATNNGSISPADFLTQLYKDGGGSYFNAVAYHPYSYPLLASDQSNRNAWFHITASDNSLRSIMDANGDSKKPIWLTEYGAPTGGPPGTYVSEKQQAAILTDAASAIKKIAPTGPLFWYSYKDIGTSETTAENFYGLLRYDGSEKPAYAVLKNLLQ